MIQTTKETILQIRDAVRMEAIDMLRRDINSCLCIWLQSEKEGKKLSQINVDIPSILDGELPEEIREELKAAGFAVLVEGEKLTIS